MLGFLFCIDKPRQWFWCLFFLISLSPFPLGNQTLEFSLQPGFRLNFRLKKTRLKKYPRLKKLISYDFPKETGGRKQI